MARPRPVLTAMMRPFWEAARRGQLIAPECVACQRRHWEPEAVCPHCGQNWEWQDSPGLATLYSFSVIYRGATPEFEVPYVLALVDLDDGWTMRTNLTGVDEDAIDIGMRLQVRFYQLDEEIWLPLFEPAPND